MLRSGSAVVGRVIGGIVALAVLAAGAIAQPLSGEIKTIVDRAKLGASRVGICIMDVETGTVLGQLRENAPAGTAFSPASNMKLLTSGSALLVLGPDFDFKTRLYKAGNRLVIEGGGDPGLADPKLLETMHQGVAELVDRLAGSIVEGMRGGGGFTEIIVDDRVFDREYTGAGWPANQRLESYCAEVSGLNFHANVLRLYATPAEQDGLAPRLRWEPMAPGLDVLNQARTLRRAETNTIGFLRDLDSNSITVKGTLKSALTSPESVSLHETGLVLARMLSERLSQAGLGATGSGPRCRLVGTDESLGAAEQTFVIVKTPMETVLERCNRDSHNLYAECLLKRVGHDVTGQPGSWTNGAAVVRMQVREKVGPEAAAAMTIVDGSGLSRADQVTPELLAGWLAAMARDEKVGEAFVTSLPLAGAEGTMAKRFRDKKLTNEVRGKSGLIDGVRCLSGYVSQKTMHAAGVAGQPARRIAYSILVNDIPASVPGSKVKEFHEEVVAAVDKWLATHSRAQAEAIGG